MGAIATRDVHIVSVIRQLLSCETRRPPIAWQYTDGTVSIYLGRDSEARELRAELEG